MAFRSRAHAQSSVPFAERYSRYQQSLNDAQRCLAYFQQSRVFEQQANTASTVDAAKLAAAGAEFNRVKCQDALLSAMVATTDPIRAAGLPARRERSACQNNPNFTTTVAFSEQRRLLEYLENKGKELLAHLLKTRPTKAYTKTLDARWSRRVVALSDAYLRDKDPWASTSSVGNDRSNCCIGFNMYNTGSVPRSLTRLIHEMCHMAGASEKKTLEPHTSKFYAIERTLLRIVTEELNWTVENWCREACKIEEDPEQRDASKSCPKCFWQRDPVLCVQDHLVDASICNEYVGKKTPRE